MKTWLRSALAFFLMLCLVICPMLMACDTGDDPKDDETTDDKGSLDINPEAENALDLVITSFQKLTEELEDGATSALDAAFLESLTSGGSVALDMDLSALMEEIIGEMTGTAIDMNAAAKVYFTEDGRMVLTATVNYMGMDLLSAEVYFTETGLVLSCPLLLGEGAYGISYEELAALMESFSGSAEPYPDEYYAIDPDTSDSSAAISEALVMVLESIVAWGESHADELDALSGDFISAMVESFANNAKFEVSEGTETITAGGENVEVGNVRISIDGPAMAGMVADFRAFLSENGQLKTLLNSFFSDNEIFAELILGSGMDNGDFAQSLLDSLDEILADAAGMAEDPSVVDVDFKISASDGSLVELSLSLRDSYDTDESELVMRLSIGENIASSKEIGLYAGPSAIKLTSESYGSYSGKVFSITADGETVMSIRWGYDENSSAFAFSMETLDEMGNFAPVLGVDGTFHREDDLVELRVETVTLDGVPMELDLALLLNANEAGPATPSYKNFSDLSESELEAIIANIESVLSLFITG